MQQVFIQGYTTPDLAKFGGDGQQISTDAFGDKVVEELMKMPKPS